MLSQVRVEVECGRERHIASGIVGNDGDVVADLALVWIALERVKQIARWHIGRPGNTGIRAKGVE